MNRKLSAEEIQSKVSQEHLIPRQIKIERLMAGLSNSDKPSPKFPKGTFKFRDTMRKVTKIRKVMSKVEKALNKKVKSVRSVH